MSHPFGDLLSQHLHRKHGLSQSKLAAGILQEPSIITGMCKGQRLSGPQARERVTAIIRWLREQSALDTLDEANRLLDAAGMAALHEPEVAAVKLPLPPPLQPPSSPRGGHPMSDAAPGSFNTFGELLKHLRLRARLTQDELGLAVGYSRAHVARLENGQRMPDLGAVRARFAEALYLRDEPALVARLIELAGTSHAQLVADSSAEPAPETGQHPPNNLPVPLTSFIGRVDELAELKRLLPGTRLLTLTGSGGVGKTRLALQLAGEVMDAYPDGVWLLELAPLADPALVPQAVAAVLGVCEEPGRPLPATLVDHLRDKRLLLVLDNCEHLIDAVARLADALLRDCRAMHLLATSREGLGITGEQAWRVPSLHTPDAHEQIGLADLARFEAVQLFDDRAALVLPAFVLTTENAPAVRQISVCLDGIPLAIELAAARVKGLSVEDIAARLGDRLHLLTGGSRTALPRQQTLRGAIDWSYELLSEPERTLLRRLSVFAGGWMLEAAEAVCGGAGTPAGMASVDVLDLLTHLVDKSLAVMSEVDGAVRYRLLETLRQYAREKLADAGEGEGEEARLRDRHLDYFLKLGDDLQPQMHGDADSDQASLFRRLALDLDNLRSAQEWATQRGRIDDGFRLLDSFSTMLFGYAGPTELLARTKHMLAQPVAQPNTRARAWRYVELVELSIRQGDFDQARAALGEVEAIGLALGDPDIQAVVIRGLAWQAHVRGDYALAHVYYEQWRAFVIAGNLIDENALRYDDVATLGVWALSEGDYAQAQRFLTEQVRHDAGSGDKAGTTSAPKRALGYALLNLEQFAEAAGVIRESLVVNRAMGDRQAVAACVAAFAALALARGDQRRAARLLGASEAITASIHTPLMFWDVNQVRRNVAVLRAQLDEATLNAEWAAGRAMTIEQAVAYALQGSQAEAEADEPPIR